MANIALTSWNRIRLTSNVATTTRCGTAIYSDGCFVATAINMFLTGSMAAFALNTIKRPGANHSLKTTLVPFFGVTCDMTLTAVVWPLLSGMIVRPSADHHVVLVLARPILGSGDDEAIVIYVAGFPLITTNYIRYVIPAIACGQG